MTRPEYARLTPSPLNVPVFNPYHQPFSNLMKTNPNAKSLSSIGGHGRQGDAMLRRVKSIPSSKIVTRSPTLAYGEKTGHHHTFSGGATAFADDEKALADFVRVTEPEAPLTHQEHSTIVFPKGDYESLKQVEDFDGEAVPVTD